jgi:hypothetical protein
VRGTDSLGLSVLALLAGTCGWATLDGLSERRSEVRCTNNLRRIGRAIDMYRDDWSSPSAELSPIGMGCPPNLHLLVGSYGISAYELVCQSRVSREQPSYAYTAWSKEMLRPELHQLRISFERNPGRFALMHDRNHMSFRQRMVGPANWIVLRFDGEIERVRRPMRGTAGL